MNSFKITSGPPFHISKIIRDSNRVLLVISQLTSYWFMSKHKLIELQKVIDKKIGSLNEEVEIGTNVKLNPLYIEDRKDEIDFLQWIMRVIQPILNRDTIHILESGVRAYYLLFSVSRDTSYIEHFSP